MSGFLAIFSCLLSVVALLIATYNKGWHDGQKKILDRWDAALGHSNGERK